MLHTFRKNQQQISGKTWKALLYSVLFVSWAVILGGTFILLN